MSVNANEQVVVKDGNTTLTFEEFADTVTRWTPQMREAAIADEGDRLELINLALANKKLAEEADDYIAENPQFKMEYLNGLRAYQRDFMLRKVSASIEMPDFAELAEEQYTVKKDKYALIPERRISSHILFSSPPGVPRDNLMVEAQEVLDQLRAGANFREMVNLHSDEPGAAQKGGKFNRWIRFGEQGVSPRYSEGLFSIENVGEYSELVNSEFGIHIIRLDGIQEKSYKSFEEVKGNMIKELEDEYRRLAMKDFVAQFQMSEGTVIDNEAIQAILEPYTAQE
ncbi:peptidylprolyl isomerase [Pseudohalioglobus sediminis]|uniref:peptidylprolyl isomerase n=1 Tax=Pseudohalioglobus sediminis TaxID=2606449 RepID=UPI00165EE12A|nr:peptidylprolyl isomerase [Pseudohalioglobus sediminis]